MKRLLSSLFTLADALGPSAESASAQRQAVAVPCQAPHVFVAH